ncbi:MAG: hypothetical protein RL516_650 [Bacteroidota bacterium]|jgi:Tol biopolymer transport system component
MKKTFAILGFIFLSSLSFGQINTTEIWLIDLIQTEEKVTAKNEIRVTNNDYYDNQPCFSKDGSMIWYASMPDTTQSDLFSYNLKLKETKQVTNTPESEYQPFPIPFYKSKLSIVRVDADGAQRFYEIEMDGSEPATLLPNEDSVAYYCWMNDTTLGTYMLNGAGGALHQFDLIPQQSILIMPNGGFGRCLAKIPGSDNLSFVKFNADKKVYLMKFDFIEQSREIIIEMPAGVEDYAWAPDGKIYLGNKGKLFYYDVKSETGRWSEVADFSKTIGNFYRMAISPKGDKIVVVSYKGERP